MQGMQARQGMQGMQARQGMQGMQARQGQANYMCCAVRGISIRTAEEASAGDGTEELPQALTVRQGTFMSTYKGWEGTENI